MAYSSIRGRKPVERASKIAHREVINNSAVRALLEECTIPQPADEATVADTAEAAPVPANQRIKAVIAVDGGYTETPVREEFPSATITFFTFGPLLFQLADLRALDTQTFIAPEDIARLKNLQRYSLAVPTRNISRRGKPLRVSVRETLQDFFDQSEGGDPTLTDALRWLLYREWRNTPEPDWTIPACPNDGCMGGPIALKRDAPSKTTCESCGSPLFLIDALRLHERIDEEQGASAIAGYVMTALEQVVLVHVIKAVYEMKPGALPEILFIKDGPLGFFGPTAPLRTPMRDLTAFLGNHPAPGEPPGSTTSLLSIVGLEKSGAFVEHAGQIADRLESNSVLPLSNDYIYRYIVPGDPGGPDPYGFNTYWGAKLIYKAGDGNVYVATVPTPVPVKDPAVGDYLNLAEILDVLGSLRCSMYDNALIPVALANKLVSLSDFPSSRILEKFAREQLA